MDKPTIPDSGPEIPLRDEEEISTNTLGMSLRDYFAGQALIASFDGFVVAGIPTDEITKMCYVIADSMLKERKI